MARILSISSQVVCGHVGNSSTQFTLQMLGHEVWALPTVLLSNHPRHKHFGGMHIKTSALTTIVEALEANGWLKDVDAVMSGYLPNAGLVHFVKSIIETVRKYNQKALYLCDPVLGDDPRGLYIETRAAETLRFELVPIADFLTPNRFELEWLTAKPVTNEAQAVTAARALKSKMILATSIPDEQNKLANLLVSDKAQLKAIVPGREKAPHGTGDFMAAYFLGNYLEDGDEKMALSMATAATDIVVRASAGLAELPLVETHPKWISPPPWPVTSITVPA